MFPEQSNIFQEPARVSITGASGMDTMRVVPDPRTVVVEGRIILTEHDTGKQSLLDGDVSIELLPDPTYVLVYYGTSTPAHARRFTPERDGEYALANAIRMAQIVADKERRKVTVVDVDAERLELEGVEAYPHVAKPEELRHIVWSRTSTNLRWSSGAQAWSTNPECWTTYGADAASEQLRHLRAKTGYDFHQKRVVS